MIHIRTNIIQTPHFSLELEEIEKWDTIIEQKMNEFWVDRLAQDWTYSFWKIFSEQTDQVVFKKSKKLSKSRLTEYYCWLPAPLERHANSRFYADCLKLAFQEWLLTTFQVREPEFDRFWHEVQGLLFPQKPICSNPFCVEVFEKTVQETAFLKEKIVLLEQEIQKLKETITLLTEKKSL